MDEHIKPAPQNNNMPPAYPRQMHGPWAGRFWLRALIAFVLALIIFACGFALGRLSSFGRFNFYGGYGPGMMYHGYPMMRGYPNYYNGIPYPMMRTVPWPAPTPSTTPQ